MLEGCAPRFCSLSVDLLLLTFACGLGTQSCTGCLQVIKSEGTDMIGYIWKPTRIDDIVGLMKL